jgi:hypothetical protein
VLAIVLAVTLQSRQATDCNRLCEAMVDVFSDLRGPLRD